VTGRDPRLAARLPLVVGAAATFIGAVSLDVLADEHPTHTVGLALVAIIASILRFRLAGRHDDIFSVVSGALVAQPALHATAKLGDFGHHEAQSDLLHVVGSDGPVTAMQIAVSSLIVIAVTVSARFVRLLLTALCRPVRLLTTSPPVALTQAPASAHTIRQGSMLHWCGWIIRTARRGPPASLLVAGF
jgi:hypothetical protein